MFWASQSMPTMPAFRTCMGLFFGLPSQVWTVQPVVGVCRGCRLSLDMWVGVSLSRRWSQAGVEREWASLWVMRQFSCANTIQWGTLRVWGFWILTWPSKSSRGFICQDRTAEHIKLLAGVIVFKYLAAWYLGLYLYCCSRSVNVRVRSTFKTPKLKQPNHLPKQIGRVKGGGRER